VADMQRIPIRSDLDIVAARVEGRNLAREIGFDIIDQARIATAITELARNAMLYAGGGAVTLRRLPFVDRGNGAAASEVKRLVMGQVDTGNGIEVVCEDRGPGIQDVEGVMRDDCPAGRGLGTGLSGTRRLMDEFDIRSEVGVGTIVMVRKWLRKNVPELAGLGG